MRIGIDMMGGDFAPLETTLGAIQARKELDSRYTLVLIGNESEIRDILRQHEADAQSTALLQYLLDGVADHLLELVDQDVAGVDLLLAFVLISPNESPGCTVINGRELIELFIVDKKGHILKIHLQKSRNWSSVSLYVFLSSLLSVFFGN